ncbi:cyclic nucleotide-binding domain-containing protein [bacterium]|nr:cyclic nucleotide-binding domain-containing protein [bacterium]
MKNLFRKSPESHHKNGQSDLPAILSRVPIFENLSKREIAAVVRILHEREYQAEEIIFRENEPGMGMYIIQSGAVAIISESGQLQLSELSDGAFFGEVALLDDAPRSATAVAKSACKIFGFFQPDLFALMERDPQLGLKIVFKLARLIAERLRKTNQRAQELNQELQKIKSAGVTHAS